MSNHLEELEAENQELAERHRQRGLAPDLVRHHKNNAEAIAALREAREALRNFQKATRAAFGAGMEEREHGSVLRQSKLMDEYGAYVDKATAALARIDSLGRTDSDG